MRLTIPAFTVFSTTVGHPCNIHSFQKCSPLRRPRPRYSTLSIHGALQQNSPPSSDDGQLPPPPLSDESYIQCPQCLAVYQIEADELDDTPRILACSACLHEWYASEDLLLWGDDMALQAVVAAKNPTMPPYVNNGRKNPSTAPNDSNGVPTPNKAQSTTEDRPRSSSSPLRTNTDESSFKPEEKETLDKVQSTSEFKYEANKLDTTESEERTQTESKQALDANASSTIAKPQERTIQTGKMRAASRTESVETDLNFKIRPGEQAEACISDDSSRNNDSKDAYLGDDSLSGDDSQAENNSSNESVKQSDDGRRSRFCIFVGNLSFRAREEDLHRAFSGYGVVVRCQIPSDPGGTSKGFGFVEMRVREEGLKAMAALQGACILGRDINLTEARQRLKYERGVTYQNISDDSKTPKGNRRSQRENSEWDGSNSSRIKYGHENSRGKQRKRSSNDKYPNNRRSSPRR